MRDYNQIMTDKARNTAASCLMLGNLLTKISVIKGMSDANYLAFSKFENIKSARQVVIDKLFTGVQFTCGMQRDHKERSFADKCKLVGEQLIDTGLRCADQHKIKLHKRDYHVPVATFDEALATCATFINGCGFHQEDHIKDWDGSAYTALTRHDADMRYCDLTHFAAVAVIALHTVHKLLHGTDYTLLDEAIAQLVISADETAYLTDIAYSDFFQVFKGKVPLEIHFHPNTGSSRLVTKENRFNSSLYSYSAVLKALGHATAA